MHTDPLLRARVYTHVERVSAVVPRQWQGYVAYVCVYVYIYIYNIYINGCGCHRRIYLGQYQRGINPGNRSLSDKIIPRIQWGAN